MALPWASRKGRWRSGRAIAILSKRQKDAAMTRTDEDGPTDPPDTDDIELRLLEAAVAEARASGPGIPHEVMRERMLEMIAKAKRLSAERLAAAGK